MKLDDDLMNKIVKNNMNVSEEVRGFMVNGQEVRGIEPTGGWGSTISIQLDNASGSIDHAIRTESKQDKLFKERYIAYLENELGNKQD